MSNEVYGFANFANVPSDRAEICRDLQRRTGLGCYEIEVGELYGFPPESCPPESALIFSVSDRPGSTNSTYLVDNIDYAPDSRIGMPLNGNKRARLLANLIGFLFEIWSANFVAIAVNDSSQIDEVKVVKLNDFAKTLEKDLDDFAPPDILYEIR